MRRGYHVIWIRAVRVQRLGDKQRIQTYKLRSRSFGSAIEEGKRSEFSPRYGCDMFGP